MAVEWTFKDYRAKSGRFPYRDWHQRQPAQFRAEFDTARRHLSVTKEWTEKDGAKALTRAHAGLTELLIDFDERAPRAARGKKRRFRPVGVVVPESRHFLLFTGCEKSGGVLDPLDAFDLALEMLDDWRRGIGEAHDHDD